MYSDPRVKERVKDLYDREKELLAVLRSIEETPITVVLGPRRVGKSSIIKTALNILAGKEKFKEYKPKHKYIPIYVDARKLVEEGSFSIYTFKKIIFYSIIESLEKYSKKALSKFLKLTIGVKEEALVEAGIPLLKLRFRREKIRVTPYDMFSALDKIAKELNIVIVIAFDEAQEIGKVRPFSFTSFLAQIHDNLRNIKIVLTGSYIGVMRRILSPGIHDHLYGRTINTINIAKMPEKDILGLLISCMREHNIRIVVEGRELTYDELYERIEKAGIARGLLGLVIELSLYLSYLKEIVQGRDVVEALNSYKNSLKRLEMFGISYEVATLSLIKYITSLGLPALAILTVNKLASRTTTATVDDLVIALSESLKETAKAVSSEIYHFIQEHTRNPKLYETILCSLDFLIPTSWSNLKRIVEEVLERKVDDKTLNRALRTLIDLGYVEKIELPPELTFDEYTESGYVLSDIVIKLVIDSFVKVDEKVKKRVSQIKKTMLDSILKAFTKATEQENKK